MKADPQEYHRNTDAEPPRRSLVLRVLLVLLAVLVLFYLLVFWVAPYAAVRYAENWYAEQGEGYRLTVGGWTLSPFTGEVALDGVLASYPSARGSTEEASVGAEHVGVNVDLAALLGKSIEIDSVRVSGLVFSGRQSPEGLNIAGILLPAADDSAAAEEPAQAPEEEAAGPLPEGWTLAIKRIDLTDNLVRWQQEGLSLTLEVNDFVTGAYSSAVQADTPLELVLTLRELDVEAGEDRVILNEPITLTLKGQARALLTHPEITSDIHLTGVDMHVPGIENLHLGALTIDGAGFAMGEDGMRAALDKLVLENSRAERNAGTSAELGSLTVTRLGWNQQRDRLSAESLSLQQANAMGGGFNDLSVGALDLSDIDVKDLSGDLAASVSHLMLSQVNADRGKEGRAEFALLELADVQGTSLISDADVTIGRILLQQPNADQPGTGGFSLEELELGAVHAMTLMSKPGVAADSLRLSTLAANAPQYAEVSLNEFVAEGVSATDLSGDFVVDVAKARLQSLGAGAPQYARLELADFSVAGVSAGASEQSLDKLELNGLKLQPEGDVEPILTLDYYGVSDIRATPQELVTGKHGFHGLMAKLVREANGNLRGLPASEPAAEEGEEQTAAVDVADEPESTPYIVRIGGIEMQSSQSDSMIYWTDNAVSPNVSTRVRILEVNSGPMDTSKLAQASPLNVVLALDDYNRISLTGTLGLRGPYPEGEAKLKVDQLNLVEFNPYLVQAMGYRLQKGMLNLNSDITITEGELGGNLKIRLQNSKFEPADEATIDRISKQISMPVETALSVLKDDNNNISIDVPLSGNIEDPDMGIDDILNQVSIKALKAATMYYLQQSLVPYGQFISIGSFVKDQLFAIRLKDLEFQPQVTELNDANRKYLDTVAGMMKEKTGLELQVCPVASEEEVKVWGDNWSIETAKRAANVKAYLADMKDSRDKVLAGRVTTCAPAKGDAPRVILGV